MNNRFNDLLNNEEYKFIKQNKSLGDNIILLTLAGSISYGTNIDASDIDLRGVTFERKENIYGLEPFEQYEDNNTDTVIYGLKKFVSLALKGNPNILELLGTNQEHILIINEYGKKLIDNVDLFLSKRIINTYGNYASAQLRRLQNALARDHYPQKEKEKHILNTLNNQMNHFATNYTSFSKGNINLYIDKSSRQDIESEIFMDVNLKHYPLRDFTNIYSEMNNIVKEYSKLNHRNRKKDEKKLYKHAMHLIRLLLTGTDILNTQRINTFRHNEKDILMDIRLGKYSYEDIFKIVDEYEIKFKEAAQRTMLPDNPDKRKVEKLLIEMYSKYYR